MFGSGFKTLSRPNLCAGPAVSILEILNIFLRLKLRVRLFIPCASTGDLKPVKGFETAFRHIFAALLFIIACSDAFAEQKIVRLVPDRLYPPFSFLADTGQIYAKELIAPGEDSRLIKGMSWDVIREAFHAAGYAIELHSVPWARGKAMVENGLCNGIFPFTKTHERLKEYIFSDFPISNDTVVVFFAKGNKVAWNGLDSLKGYRIGTIRGWSYGEKFDSAEWITKFPVNDNLQNFLKLDKGRVDGVVGFVHSTGYFLEKEKIAQKYSLSPAIENTMAYLAVYREFGENRTILDAFTYGRELILKNGVFLKITEKWGIKPG